MHRKLRKVLQFTFYGLLVSFLGVVLSTFGVSKKSPTYDRSLGQGPLSTPTALADIPIPGDSSDTSGDVGADCPSAADSDASCDGTGDSGGDG